ncbi:MFS transporter [Streptomyces abyssalis]|uniref:MFS transporter n=1 Tax=Streptomyces abyssalis TaxID=933944 RepID=A0A1E7JGP3_9ACTN|nr:MFS transporter [Streptomyces abyssalis]OEU85648.1 MFS transporter [Streptomyces abyssalis]OEU92888.1 MFS transporter [Streptomyces abyssalis]OEV30514.1 MFS transporter [Streptomyces nanshensis]
MAEPAPPRAGRREWLGLAILALPTLLLALSMTSLNLAIPYLSADLNPSGTQLLWITDIYGFFIAGTLITMGTLGDRFGRRRLLLVGSVVFGIASAVGAFSNSAEMLIVMRAVLGLSGATLMPSTLSLLSNMFRDPGQRTFAISTWMATFMGGTAIGPLVGGALLESFWWGSTLLLGVPVMVLLVAVGPLVLPESKDPDPGRLDLVSVVLSLLGILSVVYGLKKAAEQGFEPMALGYMAAGAIILAVFLIRQTKLTHPLLDLAIFRDRMFSVPVTVLAVGIFMNGGINFFLMQFLQMVVGLTPLQAGLCTLPPTTIGMATSMLAPMLVRRVRPAFVMGPAFLASAAGHAMIIQVDKDSGAAPMVISLAVMGTGFGLFMALGTSLALGAVPKEKSGVASATSETSTELGLSLGIAVLGSAGTAVYRQQFNELVPASVPDAAAASAENTIGAAVTVASKLPAQAGEGLLDAANTAFAAGLRLNSIIGAIGLTCVAVFATVMLRDAPPQPKEAQTHGHGDDDPEPPPDAEPVAANGTTGESSDR